MEVVVKVKAKMEVKVEVAVRAEVKVKTKVTADVEVEVKVEVAVDVKVALTRWLGFRTNGTHSMNLKSLHISQAIRYDPLILTYHTVPWYTTALP